jgi:hypothetical protein
MGRITIDNQSELNDWEASRLCEDVYNNELMETTPFIVRTPCGHEIYYTRTEYETFTCHGFDIRKCNG